MKFKIAIVEDHEEMNLLFRNFINRYAKTSNDTFEVFSFYDGDEITSDYEAKYDVIFFDIEMRRLDGMTAAKRIRELDKDVIIIFITNMAQFAIKGYEVDAFNFLLKPVPYFAFQEQLKKSLDIIKHKRKDYLLLNTDKGVLRLDVNDIYYVESMKHTLIFSTKIGSYEMKSSLKKMEEKLPSSLFHRCNNCYLVNLEEVAGVKGDYVVVNQQELKISRPRKKEFMERLASYFGGSL